MKKKGEMLNQAIIQIILIAVIFALFLFAVSDKVNARGVRQQVLEKQTALLVESAVPGMSFRIEKINVNGLVDDVEIKDGRIFISVEGLSSAEGYPYFTKYDVGVDEGETYFEVNVYEE